MKQIRVHGQEKRYHHVRIGINSRLDTLQAAILRVKLKYLDQELVARQKVAEEYQKKYQGSNVILPKVLPDRTHVYGQYTVRVKDREAFIENLKQQGIPTTVHYPIPLNKQPAFKVDHANCPISDRLSDEVVSLPMCLDYQIIKTTTEKSKRGIR
jgi:UDP-2-acetamido-2-deoxy-ribo-hexuluronate aminotransferase